MTVDSFCNDDQKEFLLRRYEDDNITVTRWGGPYAAVDLGTRSSSSADTDRAEGERSWSSAVPGGIAYEQVPGERD